MERHFILHGEVLFRFIVITYHYSMSATDSVPIKLPVEGSTGLAMMAPVVGLPLLFHALGGVVLTGLGFVAISSVIKPLAGKMLRVAKGVSDGHLPASKKGCLESPLSEEIPFTVVSSQPVSAEW